MHCESVVKESRFFCFSLYLSYPPRQMSFVLKWASPVLFSTQDMGAHIILDASTDTRVLDLVFNRSSDAAIDGRDDPDPMLDSGLRLISQHFSELYLSTNWVNRRF